MFDVTPGVVAGLLGHPLHATVSAGTGSRWRWARVTSPPIRPVAHSSAASRRRFSSKSARDPWCYPNGIRFIRQSDRIMKNIFDVREAGNTRGSR